MRGKVLIYDDAHAKGIISGDDGRQYRFTRGDLMGARFARTGEEVMFEPEADMAGAVTVVTRAPAYAPEKSKWIAILCALIGGGFGVHKFYLGRIGAGLLSLFFFWTALPMMIAWIEIIIYALKSEDRFYEDYELDERAWF